MTDQPRPAPGNRRFYRLRRPVDVSGISGTGFPAEIAVFSDGHAAIHWPGRYPTTTPHPGGLDWTEGIHCHHGTTLEPLDDPRLARIANAHSKYVGGGGLTDGDCNECGFPWPCPTYTWATTDRDPMATWDPTDDEPAPPCSCPNPPEHEVICPSTADLWRGVAPSGSPNNPPTSVDRNDGEAGSDCSTGVQEPEPNNIGGSELTAEEARALVDELGTDLYRAQDALALVGECCDIADREGRPITTADVREWLKGARCGRQLAADGVLPERDTEALRQQLAADYAQRIDDTLNGPEATPS